MTAAAPVVVMLSTHLPFQLMLVRMIISKNDFDWLDSNFVSFTLWFMLRVADTGVGAACCDDWTVWAFVECSVEDTEGVNEEDESILLNDSGFRIDAVG